MAFTGNATCDSFKEALFNGSVNFASDEIRIALYTEQATLNASTTAYTTDGEVVANGYTAGGSVLSPTVTTSSGVSFVTFDDVSWGPVITARGALIYKASGTAICVLDFGSNKTSESSFTVQFPQANSNSAIIRIS
jgi:hypothetical protein